jgi:glycosyltransferase involved in cell wall biosynthesis
MDLTVIVLTRNESANIQDCLRSVAWAKRRLVFDSQSTDDTVSKASELGAEVIQTEDWPGFGEQRNRALAQVRTEWVMFLDADERVQPESLPEIEAAMASPLRCVYRFPRLTNFAGQWIRHAGWYPDHVARLFRRGDAHYNQLLVHESLETMPGVDARNFHVPLLHFSYPTPDHYWRKMQTYSLAWAEQQHQMGRQTHLIRALVSSWVAFLKSYVLRLGFLDGMAGLAVCLMQAQATYSKYFMLYWMQRSK